MLTHGKIYSYHYYHNWMNSEKETGIRNIWIYN